MSAQILIWNVRGIHNNPSINHVKFLCHEHHISILALLEPMTTPDFTTFCKKLGFHHGVANTSNKIWVLWKNSIFGSLLKDCGSVIDMTFSSPLFHCPFNDSFVYAKSTRMERRDLWDDLRESSADYINNPWVIGGDFNCFLHPEERVGSSTNRFSDMAEFGQMVSDCGINDAGFEGAMHIWSRNGLQERLDRIFVNSKWTDLFPKFNVKHLARIKSDHAPLLLTAHLSVKKPPYAFRYFKMWTRHHSFTDTVAEVWKHPTGFHGMLNLHHKLIRVKQKLKWWNKQVFGNIFQKLSEAEAKVVAAEKRYDANPNPTSRIALNLAIVELVLATKIEEDYWHQKATCKWIVEGERNTQYFHNLVKQKRIRGRIHSVIDNGVTINSEDDLQKSCVNHFSYVMANDISIPPFACPFPIPQVPSHVSLTDLCSLPSEDEVKQVVFSICPNSSAGPDGFSSHFYQICWSFIKDDIMGAVYDFFAGNPLPKCYTATSIVLIPKNVHPTSWSEYRPISLCNVSNKILTKILNNRLYELLPHLISPNQSGFIKNRLISDNVLLAQELMHSITAKHEPKNVVFKLDMAKAYDRVQWDFLKWMLDRMGFPHIGLLLFIMLCLTAGFLF
ncbi:hypothetical protein DH2020_003997 [Rehmannia glutinosa]|uniref:Reverse transcriptase domain-containing protein n=1 Tax=Rehmannia glutinosa TaxID=99300 RepID=A0ABR0XN87_REHGL